MSTTKRTVIKQPNLLVLIDSDYPIVFYILKSGHSDLYRIIEEDPFDDKVSLKSSDAVIKLCHMFDSTIRENDLPKLVTIDQPITQPR